MAVNPLIPFSILIPSFAPSGRAADFFFTDIRDEAALAHIVVELVPRVSRCP